MGMNRVVLVYGVYQQKTLTAVVIKLQKSSFALM